MPAREIEAFVRSGRRVTRRLCVPLAALLAALTAVVWPPVPQAAQAATLPTPTFPTPTLPTPSLGGNLPNLLGGDFTNLFGANLTNLLGSLPNLLGGSLPNLTGGDYSNLFGGLFGNGTTGGKFSGSFTNSAGTRSYQGYVPSTYKAGTAMPLVVVLHGCTESAADIEALTQFDKLAEANKFIVVYPEQPQSANYLHCWNWFLPTDMQRGSGEPSIIAGITQWVQQHYTVDAKRTFVTGFSAGGAMSAIMGATYPDLFAAIGVGSGLQYGGPYIDPVKAGQQAYQAMGAEARVLPALIFHGGKDTTVPVADADQLMQQWKTTADWADDGSVDNSIPAGPATTRQGQVPSGQSYTVRDYVDGHGKELAQYWLVPDMTHAWSGGCTCAQYSDPSGPDESKAMWDFFVNHPMP